MKIAFTDEQAAKVLVDPSSVFSSPMAVVDDCALSTERKIEILRHWQYDALELQVGDEEGLPPREPGTLLDSIIAALHKLGASPEIEHSPPTKQRGV